MKGREWSQRQALSQAWRTAVWSSWSPRPPPPLRQVLGIQRPAPAEMSPEQMTANLRKWAIRLGQA